MSSAKKWVAVKLTNLGMIIEFMVAPPKDGVLSDDLVARLSKLKTVGEVRAVALVSPPRNGLSIVAKRGLGRQGRKQFAEDVLKELEPAIANGASVLMPWPLS